VASRANFSASASASYHPATASSSCNTGLVLTKVVLVASLSVVEITSFTLRSSLTRYSRNLCFWSVMTASVLVHWHCCDCHTGCDFLILINFMLELGTQAFSFITYATCPGLTIFFRPRPHSIWPRPRPHCSLALLTSVDFSKAVDS